MTSKAGRPYRQLMRRLSVQEMEAIMEEIAVLVTKNADGNVAFCGCADAYATHVHGMPHTTVLLIATRLFDDMPRVLLHKRSPHKRTAPNCWDFCGGHMTFDEKYFDRGEAWNSEYNLSRATLDTAIREANEELHCSEDFKFEADNLFQFQPLGYFYCRSDTKYGPNVEHSTSFIVGVPVRIEVSVWDTDMKGERQLDCEWVTVSKLLNRFSNQSDSFADGAGRILNKLRDDPRLVETFKAKLLTAGSRCKRN